MPEMDGISLLRAARETNANLVCIMMTGQATIGTAIEAMKAGALDYVLKPFKLSAILPVLARALEIRGLRMENEELAAGIRKRTKELEGANSELEAFSYSISHDLRAPLRAIEGFSRMLKEDHGPQMPADAQRLLARINTNSARMMQMIEGLLRLSRLGRHALSKRSIRTCVLVQEIIDDLHQENGNSRTEVRVDDLADCLGDAPLIRQVFVNLLSNAFKFTRQRECATIEVGCQCQSDEHLYFVRDNGAGFDMKHADGLFGAFRRMHRAETFEGTGIGLSIVRRIILRHGGRIWAEAEIDKGATFYFTLPTSA
jgi:light-regulated signal transduction histidine kinase (bacteriophytochrome)